MTEVVLEIELVFIILSLWQLFLNLYQFLVILSLNNLNIARMLSLQLMHLSLEIDLSIRVMVVMGRINHLLICLIELTDLCFQLLILHLLESYPLRSNCLILITLWFYECQLLLRLFVSLLDLSHLLYQLLIDSFLLVEFFKDLSILLELTLFLCWTGKFLFVSHYLFLIFLSHQIHLSL